MEPDYKAIGQRIRIARIRLGKTQEFIADAIDVTPAHMSNIETGKTKVSLPTLISIANVLCVSIDDLLCDNLKDSRIIFEGEAKNLFADCNEYELRFLVDLLKSAKDALRRNETVRKRLKLDS
ncbi:MAG: helix-turn-helix domain-containing protein [Lachnospiraceae bacterium]|nr:helix-turn-helix domain-containing protein [Lachnospiraceae bacterium]MDE7436140.1 helix-turn-helix domain-containing protein [Lachnospiraceae bacterium]